MNTQKTKIIIFHRGGNAFVDKFSSMKFVEEEIDVTKEYLHLGVPYRNSCSYSNAVKRFVSSANSVVGTTLAIINNIKADSWSSYARLSEFDNYHCIIRGASLGIRSFG